MSKKKSSTRKPTDASDASLVRDHARSILDEGAAALKRAAKSIDERFVEAAQMIFRCRGRVVVSGIGKAGFIAQKISATLASTGTPSLFLHPADALHGDLGRITGSDVLLALSHSGETEEMIRLIEPVKRVGARVLAMTGESESTLGQMADLTIEMGRYEEAGLGLAPTTSTTVMLGLGDALSMAVMHLRGFTTDDFHLNHPAGSLGRKLMRVREVMRAGEQVPIVDSNADLREAITVMTQTPGRPGSAIVVDSKGRLRGLFTDGDLRRLLEEGGPMNLDAPVSEVMCATPKTVRPEHMVVDAAQLLREYRVDQVPVVDEEQRPVGLLDVQDLLALRIL